MSIPNQNKKIIPILILIVSLNMNFGCTKKQDLPLLGKSSMDKVISAMTLDEKVALVVGTGLKFNNIPASNGEFKIPNQPIPGSLAAKSKIYVSGAVGRTLEIPRLGVNTLEMVDGPAGVSFGSRTTAYPIGMNLASTWDKDLVYKVGQCMGNEVSEYGFDMLLAPAMNIIRNPLTGRNFEYYSEDPFLSGKIGAAMVKGIQSQGVGTSVKHLVANNQETNRMTVDAVISERALREIYLRGFEIAVKESKPWTLMASYNSVNGSLATENYDLLTKIVREDWGYEGMIMSDWEAGKDPVAQMKAGLNVIMPGPYQDSVLYKAVKDGQLSEQVLDNNIEWILKTVLKSPKYKHYDYSNKPDLESNTRIARQAGAEGIVMLKNENNVLPVTNKNDNIALFGNGSYVTVTGGAGSGFVMHAGPSVNIIDGLLNAGCSVNEKLKRVYSKYIKDNTPEQNKLQAVRGRIKRAPEMSVDKTLAENISKRADVAVITIRRVSQESADLNEEIDFKLSDTEKNNIEIITKAFHNKGKKVIVVMNVGAIMETASWKDEPDAILLGFQPGQEAGDAIADVITGKVNPSGKLACTLPVDYNDIPSAENFPGTPKDNPQQVIYDDGIYVGYRYFNSFNVKTSFPFGFGLSYTDFDYSDLTLSSPEFSDSIMVNVKITNVGKTAGKEVVQLYVSAPKNELKKPAEELKGFAKTRLLKSGDSQVLNFKIDSKALESFNSKRSAWIADAGAYIVEIGASSEDIKLTKSFCLKDEIVEPVTKALLPKQSIESCIK